MKNEIDLLSQETEMLRDSIASEILQNFKNNMLFVEGWFEVELVANRYGPIHSIIVQHNDIVAWNCIFVLTPDNLWKRATGDMGIMAAVLVEEVLNRE